MDRASTAAWDRFFSNIGIDADSVRRAHGIGDDEAMELALRAADDMGLGGPSEEEIERLLQPLLEMWEGG